MTISLPETTDDLSLFITMVNRVYFPAALDIFMRINEKEFMRLLEMCGGYCSDHGNSLDYGIRILVDNIVPDGEAWFGLTSQLCFSHKESLEKTKEVTERLRKG